MAIHSHLQLDIKKVYTDSPEGCYIIITGLLWGQDTTVITSYAPNTNQKGYILQTLDKVMETARREIMWVRDFILVSHHSLDKHPTNHYTG